ncbi:MAG: SIS domain-containing protein [Methanosphaera sp.]|nr:SIS domain-containing protein [Methanosphaera sp.]
MSAKKLNIMNLSLKEIERCINNLNAIITKQEEDISEFRDMLIDAKENRNRVFLFGTGRSGFVAKSFAMRLMHLGFEVCVIGESIVNALEDDDVIIVISNSGKRNSIKNIMETKEKFNARLLSVCGSKDIDLYKRSDKSIVIDNLKDINRSEDEKTQLEELGFDEDNLIVMGTAFEISTLVLLDSLIIELMLCMNETPKRMQDRHDDFN